MHILVVFWISHTARNISEVLKFGNKSIGNMRKSRITILLQTYWDLQSYGQNKRKISESKIRKIRKIIISLVVYLVPSLTCLKNPNGIFTTPISKCSFLLLPEFCQRTLSYSMICKKYSKRISHS